MGNSSCSEVDKWLCLELPGKKDSDKIRDSSENNLIAIKENYRSWWIMTGGVFPHSNYIHMPAWSQTEQGHTHVKELKGHVDVLSVDQAVWTISDRAEQFNLVLAELFDVTINICIINFSQYQ